MHAELKCPKCKRYTRRKRYEKHVKKCTGAKDAMSTFTRPPVTLNEEEEANQSSALLSNFNESDESDNEELAHDATIDHTRAKRERRDKDDSNEEQKQEVE